MIKTASKPQYFLRSSFWCCKTFIWLSVAICLLERSVLAQSEVNVGQDIMTQPLTITGNTGGNIKATDISQTERTATGYCDGYINSQPNHLLQIESFFESLRLEVTSSADTTVLVKGNSGTWCSDDAGSANPILEGQWQQGLYQVWVGSYQPNSSNNYQIQINGR